MWLFCFEVEGRPRTALVGVDAQLAVQTVTHGGVHDVEAQRIRAAICNVETDAVIRHGNGVEEGAGKEIDADCMSALENGSPACPDCVAEEEKKNQYKTQKEN